jgi:phosphoenolpyruvate carboxykinase (ATP)
LRKEVELDLTKGPLVDTIFLKGGKHEEIQMRSKLDQLKSLGFQNLGAVHWNLPNTSLYEESIRRREGLLAHLGPLVVHTGQYTGRSPNDKFVVKEESSQATIWWGSANQPFSEENYERLRSRVLAYLQGRDLFIQEMYVGASARHRTAIQIISESAWHSIFSRTMFIRELKQEILETFEPEFTLIHVPSFHATPELDGTRSEVFIVLNFKRREILIGGTAYAGEIKKSVFTLMNYLLPLEGVLSMHCSANYGESPEDVSLFFGLSGTGKTTLSIEAKRKLIGDDEHGWDDEGTFNLEGGCYAKVIRISKEAEPEIYQTTRRFGTILENVAIDTQSRMIDLDDPYMTENTRAAFPISHLENASRSGIAGHPRVIFFLTADAFGVLPPIAKLTTEQAMVYFLLGYTAKVAGTERGVQEPQTTFSTCFGAPFLVHPPQLYADMLGARIRQHGPQVWMVNTGWTGGPFGEGHRMEIHYTRAMIDAVFSGALESTGFTTDPFFGLQVPTAVPGVPERYLNPRETWNDSQSYDRKASELAGKFREAFKPFEGTISPEMKTAVPGGN